MANSSIAGKINKKRKDDFLLLGFMNFGIKSLELVDLFHPHHIIWNAGLITVHFPTLPFLIAGSKSTTNFSIQLKIGYSAPSQQIRRIRIILFIEQVGLYIL